MAKQQTSQSQTSANPTASAQDSSRDDHNQPKADMLRKGVKRFKKLRDETSAYVRAYN